MNIVRMLSGGGMPPFTYFLPVAVNTAQPLTVASGSSSTSKSSSSSDATEKGALTDKDLMKMLGLIDGLPTDMNRVYDMVNTFYKEQSVGLDTSSLSTVYLHALQQLKTATFNSKQWDNAYKNVLKQGGLNEVAINENGKIVAQNADGQITYLSVDEYNQNRDKYAALTNQDLLQMRAESPNMAYQNNVFNTINNGIGMELVAKMIEDRMSNLGENSVTKSGYVQTKEGKIAKGIEFLLTAAAQAKDAGYLLDASGVSIDGFYKTKLLTKDLAGQAKQSLEYIYASLPDNAKTLLKYKLGSDEKIKQWIGAKIASQVDSTYDFDTEMLEDAKGNKPGSKDSSSKSGKSGSGNGAEDIESNLYTNIAAGIAGTNSTFTLQDSTGRGMTINGKVYPLLTDTSNKPINESSLSDLLGNGLAAVYKSGNYAITFGDKVLTSEQMEDIVYKNDHKNTRVILPTKKGENGEIVPDLEFTKNHKELIDLINEKGLNSPEVKKELANTPYINLFTGEINPEYFQSYLAINGLATSQSVGEGGFMTEIKDLDKVSEEIKRSLYKSKENNGGVEKKYDVDTYEWYKPWDWFGNYDKIYSGVIYIPLTENLALTLTGSGAAIKQSQFYELEQLYDQLNKANAAGNTSSNVL